MDCLNKKVQVCALDKKILLWSNFVEEFQKEKKGVIFWLMPFSNCKLDHQNSTWELFSNFMLFQEAEFDHFPQGEDGIKKEKGRTGQTTVNRSEVSL